MKSLKRTLCLVLALVMVLGLFGIASATNFTDDNDVQYKEAVDVMTGIGAIDGMGDGTFNPKGTITRAQAAKLVAYTILGKVAAEGLAAGATSTFSDVTVAGGYSWAIPSIEYLVKEGIINGRGDGTFDPAGNITSYELGKMLLCAIGYGAKNEYVGASWSLSVAIDGSKEGYVSNAYGSTRRVAVYSDRAANAGSLSNPATREEAALYCFNAIQKLKVEYVSTLDVYVDDSGTLGAVRGSIGTNVYPALKRETNADVFGNPGYKWTYGGLNMFSANDTPIVTFNSKKTIGDLKKAVVSAGYTWATVTPKVNNTDASGRVTNNSDSTVICNDGEVLRAYADATRALNNVIVVSTYAGKVTSVTADKASTPNIDERALTIGVIAGGNTSAVTASALNGTEGFDAVYTVAKTMMDAGQDVYVLCTPEVATFAGGQSYNAISVSIPTVATGKVASITTDTATGDVTGFVADGKSYTFSVNTPATMPSAVKVGNSYTILTDANGYVLLVDETDAAVNLGVITDVGQKVDTFNTVPVVKVVTPDGSEVELPVSGWYATDSTSDEDAAEAAKLLSQGTKANYVNKIVKYVPDTGKNEGKFKLTNKTDGNPVKVTDAAGKKITSGQAAIAGVGTATKNTVFIVQNSDSSYTTYTGVNNVPTFTIAKDSWYSWSDDKDGNVALFFAGKSSVDVDSTDVYFVAIDTSETIELSSGDYYAAGIVTGKTLADIKSVIIPVGDAAKLNPLPFIVGYETKANGSYTEVTKFELFKNNEATRMSGGVGLNAAVNNTIKVATKMDFTNTPTLAGSATAHAIAADCNVWVIDPALELVDGKFTPNTPITALQTSSTDKVFWLENAKNGQIKTMYVVKDNLATTAVGIGLTQDDEAISGMMVTGTNTFVGTAPILKSALVCSDSTIGSAYTYQWALLGSNGQYTDIGGATSANFTLTTTQITKAGSYTFKLTATPGSGDSAKASVVTAYYTVNVAQAYTVTNTNDTTAVTGLTVTADPDDATTGTLTVTVVIDKDATNVKLALNVTGGGATAPTITSKAGTDEPEPYTSGDKLDFTKPTGTDTLTYTFTITGITADITVAASNPAS